MKKLLILSALLSFIVLQSYSQDKIIKKDGGTVICSIQREDSAKIYVNITRNGRIISSYINKSEVQEIKLRDIPEKKAPLKESYLNFGIGYGPNYGIFGTKTVFGINNSGLLIGLGRTPFGTTGFEIGVQVTVKWFFINYGLATAGVHQYDDEPYENDTNFYVTLGGMVDLGKSKRTFLDLGFGFRTGKDNLDYFSHSETDDYRFNGAIGIGFRFGI